MNFDLKAALRSLKPEKRVKPLLRRSDNLLAWIGDIGLVGGPLLLDTCVYIDVLNGKSPETVDTLLKDRLCYHSAVSLAELSYLFGRLDPNHPKTKAAQKVVRETIEDVPERRLLTPNASEWGKAGILAGLMTRLTGVPKEPGRERRFLNDALILLQAQALGASVLTANSGDFDYLTQIVPDARAIFYRPASTQEGMPHFTAALPPSA